MNRRQFFTLLGFVSSVIACSKEPSTTIVIGAGLAGLGAAHYLSRNFYAPVIVLEARDRLGGRTWTSNLWNNPLDLGASWIHGTIGNPLTDLAIKAGAELVTTSSDRYRVYPTETLWQKWSDRVALALEHKPNPDRSVQRVIEEQLNWDSLSASDRKIIQSVLQSTLETEYGGSAGELSAAYYNDGDTYDGDDALFVNGYQTIVNFLAQDLDLRLNHIVSEIDWSGSGVVITTNAGVFEARQALVTLPLGVLKSNRVKFYPPLPPEKQNAIDRLGVGVLNKCYLQFPKIFWDQDVDWLQQVSPEWTEWVSFARSLNLPILLGFNGGDRGREVETLSDEETVESAMQSLRAMLGQAIPNPIGFQLTRWGKDPFALGSYSFNAVGNTKQMRLNLQAPLEKKLFFAGEATNSDFFATAHGALESGIAGAIEIAKMF